MPALVAGIHAPTLTLPRLRGREGRGQRRGWPGQAHGYDDVLNPHGIKIPPQNLLAGPVLDAIEPARVVIDCFEIFDAVRLAAEIGMNGERENFCAFLALGVEPIELIDRALGEII